MREHSGRMRGQTRNEREKGEEKIREGQTKMKGKGKENHTE